MPNNGNEGGAKTSTNGEMTQLGRKLDNPYSVKNMQKALSNLQKSNDGVSTNSIEVTTTHRYIKFKPKNSKELETLKDDRTLDLYSYPLDYEITEGSYYHDPTIPDSLPTFQYCAVPVGKVMPSGVAFEVLENLFIPDEDNITENRTVNSTSAAKNASDKIATALVNEALLITGNVKKEQAIKINSSGKWRPAGRIRVWDDVINGYIGVEGAIVRARRWFTTHRGTVNADGYYSCDGTFRNDANYSIDWERDDFALQDGWINGATYNGPKKDGNWNLELRGDEQAYYATIFSGAYFYYYKDRMGLTSPPENSFWKSQLKIKARKESGTSSYIKARKFYLGADISIQEWGSRSDNVFATTIHELAHAAHKELDNTAYNSLAYKAYTLPCVSPGGCDSPGPTGQSARRVMETWATTVEIVLTNLRYKSYLGFSVYSYPWNLQSFSDTIESQPFYTSVGFDLIDSFNQGVFGSAYVQDNVTGYTINQVENSLRNTNSWGEWREHMKEQNPSNPTNVNIDELFNNW